MGCALSLGHAIYKSMTLLMSQHALVMGVVRPIKGGGGRGAEQGEESKK